MKILPQRYPNLGVAAFVDFFDVRSAIEAKESKLKLMGCELRTNYKSKQPSGRFERKEDSAEKDKPEKSRDVDRYCERRLFVKQSCAAECALFGIHRH